MDILRIVVIIGWLVVFSGWLAGVVFRGRKAEKNKVNPWKCRLFGAVSLIVFLTVFFNFGAMAEINSDEAAVILGLVLFLPGIVLYWWSWITLGRSWASEAKIGENHKLVTSGPYSVLRHPIYFSMILMACASSFLLSNWLILILSFFLMLTAIFQARLEEKFLTEHYPEYSDYAKKTSMLIPFLF